MVTFLETPQFTGGYLFGGAKGMFEERLRPEDYLRDPFEIAGEEDGLLTLRLSREQWLRGISAP